MMKKLMKCTVSAAILATMIQATTTFASPIDSPVTQSQLDTTKGQIDDFEIKIQQLDDRIIVAMEKSQKLSDDIKRQHEKIVETEAQIEKAKQALDTHQEVYAERLRSIQLEGNSSIATYAELLLSSDNISEFLTRFTAISQIIESDRDLLNGLNEKERVLKEVEKKLQNEYNQLKKSQNELAVEQKKIEADKKEVEKELAKAKNTLKKQQDQLAQQEAQRRAQQEAQRRAQQAQLAQQRAQQAEQETRQQSLVTKASKSTPSVQAATITNSGEANKVIATAKQYLGVPYVWGGTTPSGFDCSGFTQYVFRSVGINLPRVSRDQQNVGTRISLNEVQPGDLVFRGNPAYHVGIYIGGGQYIHAPQTGDVVKISAYNPSKFTTATRVLY
ncbi:C40 family peptidase [Priestia abyssalis]|uniref:C40 family peptidase n=1 Tax=Priestia abyssalis TaxID=1221450 RepID=UPI000994ECF4|nr:C40 family peptidase [Priestia abyssalis]